MTIPEYLENLNRRYKTGIGTEHTYRGDLQSLLESMARGVQVTNEPSRVACGAPDYILTKKNIPVGYVEAKDIGLDLKSKTLIEQFDRYRASLDNLIITDYLDFHLYLEGEFKTSLKIAEIRNGRLAPLTENFAAFENLIKDFCAYLGQTIKSPKKLAEMMAAKAKLLAAVIENALADVESPEEFSMVNEANITLRDQLIAFRQILIHDITTREFADIYAQTIAYGMFAARLHDTSLDTFSRQEAAGLIPNTNPFLRKLFQYVAGYDLDKRIVWIVDGLADLFRATDVAALLKNFGNATQTHDPVIHFYETFLAEYDPKLRKARGVWYTPQPVVNFIVRAIDDILKTEFDLPDGLANNSMTTINVNVPGVKDPIKKQVHRVQFLDPATGTAAFLAELIKQIYSKFEGQQGIWSDYVEKHLIPRLNGFEILMASYAMAHLKLDLLLTETGYVPKNEQRFRIYLTNSLEEYHADTGTLFANWLSAEANEANYVKRDTPVMVVTGNPPYSGESQNKGEWIMNLMEVYKKEPGGKEKLKERNPKWINDDYVKFIRYGQYFIEKNGCGVLAFINPHGFLDNPTFRGMRWNLLKTFDKIYTIDLHGNAKKKETAPDGSIDQNVFDIMQGVSINLFIKTGKKKTGELGKVFHFDLYGLREYKYDFLSKNSVKTIPYKELPNISPNYFFVGKDFGLQNNYNMGFHVNDLFQRILLGPNSHRDDFAISFDYKTAQTRISNLLDPSISNDDIKKKYKLQDNRDWKFNERRKLITNDSKPVECTYRPFDFRYMLYGEYAFDYHRPQINDSLINKDNISFITTRQTKESFSVFISSKPLGQHKIATPYDGSYVAPLYLYPETTGQTSTENIIERTSNLSMGIVGKIRDSLGLNFTNEKEPTSGTFAPIDILDYVYAVLHSLRYREKYKEFLKIDFPRVPYPKDPETFWQLVRLGGELRQIHLLESPVVGKFITQYPAGGTNLVEKVLYENENVYINPVQYFANVPQVAWEFYIGGYQPAQKWLKDRKNRELGFNDILHYQKIIVALAYTDRLMKEIDKIEFD